jgi:hypothetical protein
MGARQRRVAPRGAHGRQLGGQLQVREDLAHDGEVGDEGDGCDHEDLA